MNAAIQEYLLTLESEFVRHANPQIAAQQEAYLKNQFRFYGLTSPVRKAVQKPFLDKNYLPPKQDLPVLVKALWAKPEREYQHFAQELACKYLRQPELTDMALYEYMVAHHSWWDTVDHIANKLMGSYLLRYPQTRGEYVEKWLSSGHLWLQRSAILFQLKYKEDTDSALLSSVIHRLLGSKEFFINKAIGWVLREYAKTHPEWVIRFVEETPLAPLSRREAMRILERKG